MEQSNLGQCTVMTERRDGLTPAQWILKNLVNLSVLLGCSDFPGLIKGGELYSVSCQQIPPT